MTLDELIEEVYLITNRRDLVAETKSAVKAATMKAHNSDFYSKDLYESGIEFTTANFNQSLDIYTFLPNFRALKYLRVADSASDNAGPMIEIITPEEVLDSYSRNRTDVAYMAGRVLEIRTSTNLKYALIGAYVRPITTDLSFSSWIADLQPYAIIYEAVRVLFRTLGNLEESNAYSQLLAEEYSLLKMNGLTDYGY